VANVSIEGLTKRFAGKPPTTAMQDVQLEIEQGEFLVLLGPSGCGKTTTLRCLAGLETPDTGRISFGDRTVFDADRRVNIPPDKRNVGMVFQSYALWPHMTVRKNIGYPLRARKVKSEVAAAWISETAELVDCAALLDRYPAQLSGGQQQRVALARGLVARPDLLLFDEPLSNLDARLRDSVRAQLHELHARLGFTAVFVTHDQTEALALGDRLAIMRAGAIEQLDTPERIFEAPATEYVAEFIGMSNRVVLELRDGVWTHEGRPVNGDAPPIATTDDTVVVRAGPGDLALAPLGDPLPPGATALMATVVDSEFGGRHMDVIVTVGACRFHARIPTGERNSWARTLDIGQDVALSFRLADLALFDRDDARLRVDIRPARPAPAGV
jgi:iron(III) transport system ATP-binding protein